MKRRMGWILGVLSTWGVMFLLLGIRALIMLGTNPHPFLPTLHYTGIMLRAVAEWAGGALGAYALMGLVFSFIGFLGLQQALRSKVPDSDLGFLNGLRMGSATVMWVHGVLFLLVPGTICTLPFLRRWPMVFVLALFLGTGATLLFKILRRSGLSWAPLRAALVLAAMSGLLFLPHDLFRRMVPGSAPLPRQERRLVVLSVDGLRQDVAEAAVPAWKAPDGVQPIVAVPATRLTWNMLVGGDPEFFANSFVVPFKSEWVRKRPLVLLEKAKTNHISTAFLIDDCTTLSFGLSTAPFTTVIEPFGGWKHYFTAGAGFTWPIYSWAENFTSPVETTNPWAESKYFWRDVEREIDRNQWVSAHTCQLHAPFYLRIRELQAFRPWKWLFQSSRSYESYQAAEQAERDHFSRAGLRADPLYQYGVRATELVRELAAVTLCLQEKYPGLSGVCTADHGELHPPILTQDGTVITRLTGIHGFTLEPDTVRIPMHPFGCTQWSFQTGDVFSWLDLRDRMSEWLGNQKPLRLSVPDHRGCVIRWQYLEPIHVEGAENRQQQGSHQPMTAGDLVRATYLLENGGWYMEDDPKELLARRSYSYALVRGDAMVTFTPVTDTEWIRVAWKGYRAQEQHKVEREALEKEISDFNGRTAQQAF